MSTEIHSHLEAWLVRNSLLSSLRLLAEYISYSFVTDGPASDWLLNEDCPQVPEVPAISCHMVPQSKFKTQLFASLRPTGESYTPVY